MKILLVVTVFIFAGCTSGTKNNPQIVDKSEPARQKRTAEYKFSSDWFSSNIPVWKKHLAAFKGRPNITYLEVGVYEGRSAFWVMENILTGKNTKAYFVDLYNPEYEPTFLYNLKISGRSKDITVLKGFSEDLLKNIKASSVDIIYIDGGHAGKNVYLDAALSWLLLKPGGVLIFDDYGWNLKEYPPPWRPKEAIDGFLRAFGEDIQILYKDWQVIVRKKKHQLDRVMSRVGTCVYIWGDHKVVDSNHAEIQLSAPQLNSVKRILKQRNYLKPRDFYSDVAKFKKLTACDPKKSI